MSTDYHYARGGTRVGPVSVSELRRLLKNGTVSPSDLVWTSDMPDWRPASERPELLPGPAVPTAAEAKGISKEVMAQPPLRQSSHVDAKTASSETENQTSQNAFGRFVAGAVAVAVATANHLTQFSAYVAARIKLASSRRAVVEVHRELGTRLFTAGQGSDVERRLVGELTERIASLKAAGSSTRAVETELRAAYTALGASAANPGGSSSSSKTQAETLTAAEARYRSAQSDVDARKTELNGMRAVHGSRIVVGYVCCGLLMATLGWASWSPRDSGADQDPASITDDPIGTGGGNDFNPIVPPAQVTGGGQESICLNCNGSGQSDCTACFGSGKRQCFNCNGRGRTVNNLNCFQCNGTGQQNCSFCTYGKVQCPQCFGRGRR